MAVVEQDEAVALAHLVLKLLDPLLVELHDAAALLADQVIVVIARPQALVSVARLADAELPHDPGVGQELERAVDGGPGDFLVLGPQPHEQLVGLQVLVAREDFVKERAALGGQLEAPPLQVLAEDVELAVVLHIATESQLRYSPGSPPLSRGQGEAAAMWQGFTIALREGIEAFLIVALTLSYLKRTGREALARAVYCRVPHVSVITCTAAGFLFEGDEPVSLGGILALTAAILVGSLLLYMKRISKSLKSDLENRLETRAGAGTGNRALWGVFAFTVLMITREGMETALLIATALFQLKSSAVFLGLALGLVAAALTGLAWTRFGRDVDLPALLNVSAVFLAIFLVQLLLYSVHEFSEARLLPASQAIHDATEILGPDGKIGHLLAYSLAVIPTLWLGALWWKRRRQSAA